ncbi:MAG TPA: hypothetical protein VF246_05705 [Acidimicrobiia bacterium]
MSGRRTPGVWLVGALVLALVLPASLATGSGWKSKHKSGTDAPDNVVLLTLGKTNHVKWGDLKQGIFSKGGCNEPQFGNPDILSVTAGGGSLTLKQDGFGVKAHTAWGCDTVDKGESLTVSSGEALLGWLMAAVDLDLELSKGAKVEISFRRDGNEVASETFSPYVKSDGTHVRYFKRPKDGGSPILFDEIVLTSKGGWFSLEGGDDQKDYGKLAKSKASQFEVVAFDGEITCQDTVTIAEPEITTVAGMVTMRAMGTDTWQTDDCQLKFYNDDVGQDFIAFLPSLAGLSARYTMDLTIHGQAITFADGVITSLGLTYDPEGQPNPTRPLLECLAQPVLGGEGYDAFWSQADVGLLPEGETACFFDVGLKPTGPGVGTESWKIYFEDDPIFGFK